MNSKLAWVIAAVTVINILAALWLIWWTTRGSTKTAAHETTHVWDDDLTEYNNPLPRWWLWLFIITIVFAVIYLALFPGLGNFAGTSHWSSVGQYQAEKATAAQLFESHLAQSRGKSLSELSRDPVAMATARNLFALNCSTCHGSDARGAKGFPNLTDGDWLWGSSAAAIYQSIAKGRDNAMPAWGNMLKPSGVSDVLAYVYTLSGQLKAAEQPGVVQAAIEAGHQTFSTLCAACHGADGRGNQSVGAPNLTDQIWLHGGSSKDIEETITHGRINHMPAHLEILGEEKVRLLAAYVLSVSAKQNPTRDESDPGQAAPATAPSSP